MEDLMECEMEPGDGTGRLYIGDTVRGKIARFPRSCDNVVIAIAIAFPLRIRMQCSMWQLGIIITPNLDE
jgi:hypothetical protein